MCDFGLCVCFLLVDDVAVWCGGVLTSKRCRKMVCVCFKVVCARTVLFCGGMFCVRRYGYAEFPVHCVMLRDGIACCSSVIWCVFVCCGVLRGACGVLQRCGLIEVSVFVWCCVMLRGVLQRDLVCCGVAWLVGGRGWSDSVHRSCGCWVSLVNMPGQTPVRPHTWAAVHDIHYETLAIKESEVAEHFIFCTTKLRNCKD